MEKTNMKNTQISSNDLTDELLIAIKDIFVARAKKDTDTSILLSFPNENEFYLTIKAVN